MSLPSGRWELSFLICKIYFYSDIKVKQFTCNSHNVGQLFFQTQSHFGNLAFKVSMLIKKGNLIDSLGKPSPEYFAVVFNIVQKVFDLILNI